MAGFGGVEPVTVLAVTTALVVPTFALAAATLLASVWCRETRDAVLALYAAFVAAGVAVYLVGGPLRYLDPLYVVAPAWGPAHSLDLPETSRRLLGSVAAWAALGGLCLGLGMWRLRPTYVRELESCAPARAAWYQGDRVGVGDDPVRWRERHVEGLAPNPTLRRVPQWLGVGGVALLTFVSSCLILYFSLAPGAAGGELLRALFFLNLRKAAVLLPDAGTGFLYQALVALVLASLTVGVRCSGAVTGERERQTWEALLLTPVSARQIVRGKLWGILAASYWYLLAYAAPAVVLSVLGGPLALVWTVLWLAVTALAMYFIGATGLYCSTTSRNSWRSLLATLSVGYVGGSLILLVTSPALMIVAVLLYLLLLLVDVMIRSNMAASFDFRLFIVATCVSLAVIFWLMARLFLNRAHRYIADRERTRHWYEEPLYRRPRRARSDEVPRLSR
jgi:ABC-type transport system involved in multi-copper enzyme maturation permease subunit